MDLLEWLWESIEWTLVGLILGFIVGRKFEEDRVHRDKIEKIISEKPGD